MPYSKEAKLLAKRVIGELRTKTVCKYCGSQPIEWHREEHTEPGNLRVAHLVALGFPLQRIYDEIAKCTPLCRSCHMIEDDRAMHLQLNKPNQKGSILAPVNCRECGKSTKPSWKGMCRKCYDYWRRGRFSMRTVRH